MIPTQTEIDQFCNKGGGILICPSDNRTPGPKGFPTVPGSTSSSKRPLMRARSALAGFTLPPPTGSAYVVETAQREGRVPDLAALDAGAAACVSQPYIAGVLALPVRFARPQRSGVRGY